MASLSNSSASTTSSEIQEAALLSKSLSPRCPKQEREGAYLKVISQSTSSSLYLRKLVGKLIPQYFIEFDTLQEKAVDAICDLCEDSEKEIRTVGYNAFIQISRVATSWVKRNTDVLIQLLQIDAEDEILILRRLIAAHIEISISALSVIIDSLIDPGIEAGLKLTLVDILTVEGTQWRNQNTPLAGNSISGSQQGVNTESEGGRALREGLNFILSQSPLLPLVEKIYSLLFLLPIPTTARQITHILSYSYPSPLPPSLFAIAQQHVSTAGFDFIDPRSFVRYYFEQSSNSSFEGVDLDLNQERTMLLWVKQWAERASSGTLRQELEGDEDIWVNEDKEEKKIVKDGKERWQILSDKIADQYSSKVLPLLRSGRRDRNGLDLPFQALEACLFILFYLSRIPSVAKRSIDPGSQLVQYINQRIGPGRPQSSSNGSTRLAQSNVWFLLDYFRKPILKSKDASWPVRKISFSWETKHSGNHNAIDASPNYVASTSQSAMSTPVIHSWIPSSVASSGPSPASVVDKTDLKKFPVQVSNSSLSMSQPAAPIRTSSSDLLRRLTPQSSQVAEDSERSLPRHPSHPQRRPSPVHKPVTPNVQNRHQSNQVPNLSTTTNSSNHQSRPHPSKHDGSGTGLGFSIKGRASSAITTTVSPPLSSPAATPSLRDRLAPSMGNAGVNDGTPDAGWSSGEGRRKRKSTGSSGGRRKR